MAWTKVADKGEIAPGRGKMFVVGGKKIAVFNQDGYHAIDDVCVHQDGSLAPGKLDGDIVECPLHFWHYNIRTGELTDYLKDVKLETYQVQAREDGIYVKDHGQSEIRLDDLVDDTLRDTISDNHHQRKRTDKESTQPSSDLGSADKAAEDRILNSDDPYVVLGVSRNATGAEIKSAHRNLVKMFHPSKGALHKSAAEQARYDQIMKKINHAYEQLKKTRKGDRTDR